VRVCVHMELGLGTHRHRGAMYKVNRAKGGGTSMASAGMSPSSTTTFSRLRRCTEGNVYAQKRREETRHTTTDYRRNSVSYGGDLWDWGKPRVCGLFSSEILNRQE